jgi:polysaccharide deacetylase family sporulation protein PdaB
MHLLLLFSLVAAAKTGIAGDSEERGRAYFERRGEVIWEVPTDKKVIALTFDDGPNPVYTPQILSLLKEYHAKATFFVVGAYVQKYPEIAQQVVRMGHEIANHTYSHPNMRKLSSEKIKAEIEQTKNAVFLTTGALPRLFRPPGGYYGEKVVRAAREGGNLVVMWSWHQDTRDWRNPGVRKIVEMVLANARNGDIVLFHDNGGNRSQTVMALKEILPELERRGYRLITVTELINLRNKVPVNKRSAP